MGTILIPIFSFVALMLVFVGLHRHLTDWMRRRDLIRRIERSGDGSHERNQAGDQGPATEGEAIRFLRMTKEQITKYLSSLGNLVKPREEKDLSDLRKNFVKAGYYRTEKVTPVFYGLKVLVAVLSFLVLWILKAYLFKATAATSWIFVSVLPSLIGFYLPDAWLHLRIGRRKKRIQQGLPDALDLMVVCAEAGVGLDAAVSRVGEEMKLSNKPLSEEFTLLNLELRAGKQRQEAFRNLAARIDLEDVRSLVSLLIQTERFGTSIGKALRVHSDSMRTKRYQKAEAISAKVPVKLTVPLVLFIFPALLLVVMGPAAISVYRTLGPMMSGGH